MPLNYSIGELGPDMVKIYVGKKKLALSVHRSLLSKHSSVWAEVLRKQDNGEDLASYLQQKVENATANFSEQSITLPHPGILEEPFKKLIDWLYEGTLSSSISFATLHHTYKLASKFEMPRLLNNIVDEFRRLHPHGGSNWKVCEIKTIYLERHLGQGMLWKFCLHYLVGKIAYGDLEPDWKLAFKRFYENYIEARDQLFNLQLDKSAAICAAEFQARGNKEATVLDSNQFHVPVPKPAAEVKKSKKDKKNEKNEKRGDPLRGVNGSRIAKGGSIDKGQRDGKKPAKSPSLKGEHH